MYTRVLIIISLVFCFSVSGYAKTEFFKKFKSDYNQLSRDLLKHKGEIATIENFVYQKDELTFTLDSGIIHLLRYVNERPTTAIFVGQGHAAMTISSALERQALLSITKDSVVEADFEVLFIRFADDFDLKLKEQFTFKVQELDWKIYNAAKKAQGETFFIPLIQHQYDNYFQLLRSLYERNEDGYFWADFNRYIFSYDPNRPEEVQVDYEFQGGDFIALTGAALRRKEMAVNADTASSSFPFPTTILSRQADIELTGLDGRRIDAGATIELVIEKDSLKFISTWLQFNLKTDSIYYEGKLVDYWRRKDFSYIGIILPEYRYKGDTISLTYFYEGSNFDHFLPYVENPAPTPHTLNFTVPKGHNYYMPWMSEVSKRDRKRDQFTVVSAAPSDRFYFHTYASGNDTVTTVSDIGITLNFLTSLNFTKKERCFIPHDMYRKSITDAFNYYSSILGGPLQTFAEYVIPEGFQSMPGLLKVPQLACVTEGGWLEVGGFDAVSGNGVARQWFGSLMRPATHREIWTLEALPQYLGMMHIQKNLGGEFYYTNLFGHRDSLYLIQDLRRDMPLATGTRADLGVRSNKGVWLMHMLRMLMYDLETRSEKTFMKFFRELYLTVNYRSYRNVDIMKLAEKHYKQPLDWFFKQWLYGFDMPTYDVKYSIDSKDGQYFVNGTVRTERMRPDFTMPIIMRVEFDDGNSVFSRETISGAESTFALGPFDKKPKAFIFNELYSVLSRDNVSKK